MISSMMGEGEMDMGQMMQMMDKIFLYLKLRKISVL